MALSSVPASTVLPHARNLRGQAGEEAGLIIRADTAHQCHRADAVRKELRTGERIRHATGATQNRKALQPECIGERGESTGQSSTRRLGCQSDHPRPGLSTANTTHGPQLRVPPHCQACQRSLTQKRSVDRLSTIGP
jgi:hypothetical protein